MQATARAAQRFSGPSEIPCIRVAHESPHDALFKEIFSHPELARVELRAVLPAALSALVDWNSLRLEPGSFVEVRDRDRFADLMFGVRVAERPAFIYLLFEHQSSPDRYMPLRLLGYLVRKWERLVRDDPSLATLPPIVPVVLHHGAAGWSQATSFHEQFAQGVLQEFDLVDLVPNFRFVLDDLCQRSDTELRARAVQEVERIVPVVLLVLRDARSAERLLASLAAWAGVLTEVHRAPSGKDALLAVFSYISRVTQHLSPRAILRTLELAAPETKDLVMTLADQWLQAGIEKGIEKGERTVLAKLLGLKFGPLMEADRVRLERASASELERWAERVLFAATIDDVFG